MIEINQQELEQLLDFPTLIASLDQAFQSDFSVPMRHHHDYSNPDAGMDSTLLLMPAWKTGDKLGVKIVTVSPNNAAYQLPAIQGIYLLFDATTGVPLAQLEAKTLTTRRTAATSALASSYLSRPDSDSLLMVGTGALAPNLILAHAAVRPITKVFVWGRSEAKAQKLSEELSGYSFQMEPVQNISDVLSEVAIVSCATLSETPLVFGQHLNPGQHIDLVGSYKPNMREADDEAVRRSRVFLDVMESGLKESGDIAIPLQNGTLSKDAIQGDLFQLTRKEIGGRSHPGEITYFKSVGHALEDLAAAKLAYQKYTSSE